MISAGTDSPVSILPVSICDLVRLWKTDMTPDEIAIELNAPVEDIIKIAKSRRLRHKPREEPEIPPEEIRRRAEEIQAGWTETERRSRQVIKHRPAGFYSYDYNPTTGTFTHKGFA